MVDQSSSLLRIVSELRRRHVFRVVAAYAVFMFVLLQVIDIVLPALLVPDWVITVIVVLGIAGLPLAAVLTWVYDITPEGVVRTARLTESERRALRWNWRWLDYFVIAALAGILIFVLVRGPPRDAGPGRSIAVLPFSDLSEGQDNAYFSHGMSEAVIDSLARLEDLHVASRTSSFRYRDTDQDIREVAGQLGVSTVLEGSVRKAGGRVMISARLVDGRRGINLWNETYTATLDDIFRVQDNIARAIADVLQVRLLGDRPLVAAATGDRQAYDAYLRGRDYLRRGGAREHIEQAIAEFGRALEFDGGFTLAEAGLCRAYWERYRLTRNTELAAQAIDYCQQVGRKGDTRTEILVALADLFRGTGQTARARALLQRALEIEPNNTEVHAGLGEVFFAEGQLEAAEAHFVRAIELDPAFWRHQWALGDILNEQGRRDEAIAWIERAIRLEPDNPELYSSLGGLLILQGDHHRGAEALRRSIEMSPNALAYSNAGAQFFYAGNYAQAEAMFRQAAQLSSSDHIYHAFLAESIALQDSRGAEEFAPHFNTAIRLAYLALEVNPEEHETRAQVARYLAQSGRTEEAEAELERLEQAASLDMVSHRFIAMAYLHLGRWGQSLAHLKAAVERGYPSEFLMHDPRLAPLHGEPEFAALIQTLDPNRREQ